MAEEFTHPQHVFGTELTVQESREYRAAPGVRRVPGVGVRATNRAQLEAILQDSAPVLAQE
ncbi:MAG TPA: hypothetical protein PLD23_10785 [Armatimonadota bacterium]|nr:hypothetical protein [Armatimonadota bacterium]